MDHQEAELVVTVADKVCVLRFNRPKKKNAINSNGYITIIETLKRAATDPDILLVVVTGTGEYFTSGNEFSPASMAEDSSDSDSAPAEGSPEGINAKAKAAGSLFKTFIRTLIDFPKPLVGVVNGPAVGVGVTMLGLFDVVYASDKATFHTPFVTLGLMAEGCSSYLFPRIMGPGKAAELLIFGKKLTAAEACSSGLVTAVYPHASLHQVWPLIHGYAKLLPNTVVNIKAMIKAHHKDLLHKVNDMETKRLMEVMKQEEAFIGMMNFFTRKSRL